MKIQINTVSADDFVIIPEKYKDEKQPPKFIFRQPNSSDLLRFVWGGGAIDRAIFDCFKRFENKIELETPEGEKIEYNSYEEFINIGVSVEIAAIHHEITIKFQEKLTEMLNEGKKVEKKSK